MTALSRIVTPAIAVALVASAGSARAAADSHTLYLDPCQPNGCTIKPGATNATTDTSDIPSAKSTVTAFAQDPSVWAAVVSCVKEVMAPFDLTVTDQRPAAGPYFRVVVAGTSSDLGLTNQLLIGDVSCTAVGTCSPYLSNALAFAFANDPYLVGEPDAICAAAAQAIATTWALDRVVDPTDVMAFSAQLDAGVRTFHDHAACGGDCVNGTSPLGLTCTGSGATATHACMGNGQATQDEVQALLALFGPAPITSEPSNDDAASPIDAGGADAGGALDAGGGDDAGSPVAGDAGPAASNEDASSNGGGCATGPGGNAGGPFILVSIALAAALARRRRARGAS